MTNTNPDDTTDGIDRRTVLQLASSVGLGSAFAGTAIAEEEEGTAPADEPPFDDRGTGEEERWADGQWFVEFAAAPAARGGSPSERANERAAFASGTQRAGIGYAERYDFSTLWNGLSVEADIGDAYAMSSLDPVEAVYPVALAEVPEPGETDPEMATAAAMTGADRARKELGYTGEGVSVGIIDTGIDYNHPDLGGTGDPDVVIEATDNREFDHPRISHGWDYVGESSSDPQPNPNPMDHRGHGTHVAGISGADAASDSGVTGVAPDVTLGAYKVFPDVDGGAPVDLIVQALEDSYEDGMDVVNMSIGSTLSWGQAYPTTAASNELVNQGVVVVSSAGNDGDLGLYTISPPANAHDAIGVASVENESTQSPAYEVINTGETHPYYSMTGAEAPPEDGETAPLALPSKSVEDGEEGYFGCQPEDFDEFPDGHVALISRGHCTFAQKYTNAAEAGAVGVLIYNDSPGSFNPTINEAGVEGVWGTGTSLEAGEALADLLEAGEEVTLAFLEEPISEPNPAGGLLSDFSSYGQTVELVFGPNVSAPGGSIRSTYPLDSGEYSVSSGTSMAAPHVAGTAALLLAADSDLDPFDVRDRLQNTSEPMTWSLNRSSDVLDHTFRQGSGLVQIDRALEADRHVSPGQISAGDGEGTTETVTVTNDGAEAVTYAIDHRSTMRTAYSSFDPTWYSGGSTIDAPESVTVPAGESVSFDVAVSPPPWSYPNHQYGGFVELVPDAEALSTLRVPYAGYEGDYTELPLFGHHTQDGFQERLPNLSRVEEGSYVDVEEGYEFSLREGDEPVIDYFLGHFPRVLRVYAVDQEEDEEWLVMEDEYASRNSGSGFFWTFFWDGTTAAGRSSNRRPVSSGPYTLRMEGLRPTGDPDTDAHWDTWESPVFELDSSRSGQRSLASPGTGVSPADGS